MLCCLASLSVILTIEKVKILCRMNSVLLKHKEVWEILILKPFKEKIT